MATHVAQKVQYPTPDFSHRKSYNTVYEPAEDSFLFLDALEQDQDFLKERNPVICVEVGSGSGVILTFLASILADSTAYYIAVDINPEAVQCTSHSLLIHSIETADSVCDNLLTSLQSRLRGSIDMLIFNPPYVSTPSDEVGRTGLSTSWAGGTDGREVINLLLPQVKSLLSDGGCFYLMTVQDNRPDDICEALASDGLSAEKFMTRRAHNEQLTVLKVVKDRITDRITELLPVVGEV